MFYSLTVLYPSLLLFYSPLLPSLFSACLSWWPVVKRFGKVLCMGIHLSWTSFLFVWGVHLTSRFLSRGERERERLRRRRRESCSKLSLRGGWAEESRHGQRSSGSKPICFWNLSTHTESHSTTQAWKGSVKRTTETASNTWYLSLWGQCLKNIYNSFVNNLLVKVFITSTHLIREG